MFGSSHNHVQTSPSSAHIQRSTEVHALGFKFINNVSARSYVSVSQGKRLPVPLSPHLTPGVSTDLTDSSGERNLLPTSVFRQQKQEFFKNTSAQEVFKDNSKTASLKPKRISVKKKAQTFSSSTVLAMQSTQEQHQGIPTPSRTSGYPPALNANSSECAPSAKRTKGRVSEPVPHPASSDHILDAELMANTPTAAKTPMAVTRPSPARAPSIVASHLRDSVPMSALPRKVVDKNGPNASKNHGRSVFVPCFHGKAEDHYHFVKKLGAGSFGTVYEASAKELDHQTNKHLCARPKPAHVAVKVFHMQKIENGQVVTTWRDKALRAYESEVNVLRSIDHPNLVNIYETFELYDEHNQIVECAVVMELCRGGDLLETVVGNPTGLEPEIARHVIWQIVCAVRHLQSRGWVHRDLKLENIFFLHPVKSEGRSLEERIRKTIVKVGDFGSAVRINGTMSRSRGGSPSYLPPEVWLGNGWNPRGDSWSFGVVSYATLIGSMPFPQPSHVGEAATMQLVTQGKTNYTRPTWQALDPIAQDFVQRCLVISIDRRMCIQEAAHHPFFAPCMKPPADISRIQYSISAWRSLDPLSQLALQALATVMDDSDIPEAFWLFHRLDKDGMGYSGNHQAVADALYDRPRGTTIPQESIQFETKSFLRRFWFDVLDDVSYTGLIAVLLAQPQLWVKQAYSGHPGVAAFARAVLRSLVSCGEYGSLFTSNDLNIWLPGVEKQIYDLARVAAMESTTADSGDSDMNDKASEGPTDPLPLNENAIQRFIHKISGTYPQSRRTSVISSTTASSMTSLD